MSEMRPIQNLALIGFMGTGKSAVGRLVAQLLHFTYLDTDQVIESRAHKTIREIFEQEGEPVFRNWEQLIVGELTQRTETVISTGGGLPIHQPNMDSLKKHSLVVCLWATAETIYERVCAHDHRPLLQDTDPSSRIRELLAAREPFYRQADVLINTERRSIREVAVQVIHQFHMARAAQ